MSDAQVTCNGCGRDYSYPWPEECPRCGAELPEVVKVKVAVDMNVTEGGGTELVESPQKRAARTRAANKAAEMAAAEEEERSAEDAAAASDSTDDAGNGEMDTGFDG